MKNDAQGILSLSRKAKENLKRNVELRQKYNEFIKLQLDEKKILLDNIHVIALVNDPETSFKEKDWGIDRLKDIMAATSAKFGL
jgi:hypothetical protein